MAITRETKVTTTKAPSDYTPAAQVYKPSATASCNRNRTLAIPAATEVDPVNLTGFTNLLTEFDTVFAASVEPTLGLDATQTISMLLQIKNVQRASTTDLIGNYEERDELYKTGVDTFIITYDIYFEEVV